MVKTNKPQNLRIKNSRQDLVFVTLCVVALSLFCILTLYPILYVISSSFSSGRAVGSGKVVLWPVDISLEGYQSVFRNRNIISAYANTILYTSVGSFLNVAMALSAAYPLARKDLPGKN